MALNTCQDPHSGWMLKFFKEIYAFASSSVRPKDRWFNSNYKGYILGYPQNMKVAKNQVLSQNPNKQGIVFRVSPRNCFKSMGHILGFP
jgi:hypothetical protein